MITANIKFLNNHTSINLPCSIGKIMDSLGCIGVLINPDNMLLDNARTVKVQLSSTRDIGENIISLINPTDTLGKLNRLCNTINDLEPKDYDVLQKTFQGNKLKSFDHTLEIIDRLKEKRKCKENLR